MKEYNFEKFIKAQESSFDMALKEIKKGHKQTHWMWYIFPQLKGLGSSAMSEYYAIQDLEEAKAYLRDPLLRYHLLEICEALLKLKTNDILEVMDFPDNLKLCSSMTLFSLAEPTNERFKRVLNKYFNGQIDEKTIMLIKKKK